MNPLPGLRILRRSPYGEWSSYVLAVGTGSRPHPTHRYERETYLSIDTMSEGHPTLCSIDLANWPNPWNVRAMRPEEPIVSLGATGAPQGFHGRPVLDALRELRRRYLTRGSCTDPDGYWPHIDDALAIEGVVHPRAARWDLARTDAMRAARDAFLVGR